MGLLLCFPSFNSGNAVLYLRLVAVFDSYQHFDNANAGTMVRHPYHTLKSPLIILFVVGWQLLDIDSITFAKKNIMFTFKY